MTVEAPEQRPLDERPDLRVEFRHIGPICVLSLCGELHAGSVEVLESQFDHLGRTPCHRVVLDLSELADLDPTGARVLIGLRHYVHARGGRLRVLGPSPLVRATLAAEEALIG